MMTGRNPTLFFKVIERLYLSDHQSFKSCDPKNYKILQLPQTVCYHPYCDDFGPTNLSAIYRFNEAVESSLLKYTSSVIVFCSEITERMLTNSVFLLGGYLILVLKQNPEEVWKLFESIDRFENYRDATFSKADFWITLLDCWKSLFHARALGWIGCTPETSLIDIDEYEHYDCSLNAEFHMVIPGKFLAFRGPRTLPGGAEYVDIDGVRIFSAEYYVDIFRELGVTTVIRLNESEYDCEIFTSAGIDHLDLPFDDCTPPPAHIVSRFLGAAERTPGIVAVHCKAGLGRTGTLIAVYAMLAHGFGASEAIAWLRILRPGCVIGPQQQYLCDLQLRMRGVAPPTLSPPPTPVRRKESDAADSDEAQELARQVTASLARHVRLRVMGTPPLGPQPSAVADG